MKKEEEHASKFAEATSPQQEAPRSTLPTSRFLITVAIAVILGLSFQKATPALDVALSLHAKVTCSAHFVAGRNLSAEDTARVRNIVDEFHGASAPKSVNRL